MLTRIRKAIEEKDAGFTLIELLVVMIIIGILAMIAIPVFLNQRKSAVDSAIKSDLRTISTEVESYYTDTQVYPTTAQVTQSGSTVTLAGPPAVAIRVTSPNTYAYKYQSGTDSYCIIGNGASGKSNGPWIYDSAKGGLQPKGTAASTCP